MLAFFSARRVVLILVLLPLAYVSLYLYLSRRGDAWAKSTRSSGFLYVLPEDTRHWEGWHRLCRDVFGPANDIDRALGSKRQPITNICGGLSR